MDQIEEVSPEFVQYKNEQCIQIRFRDGIRDGRVVLTNPVSVLIDRYYFYTVSIFGFSVVCPLFFSFAFAFFVTFCFVCRRCYCCLYMHFFLLFYS